MAIRRTLLGLCIALAACGAPGSQTPPGAAHTEAAAPRFAAGDRFEYRFDWSVGTRLSEHPVLPSELGLEGGLHLAGAMRLDVVAHGPGGSVLAVSWPELETSDVLIMGKNAAAGTESLVGKVSYVTIDANGRYKDIHFEPDASPLYRRLMTGMLAQVDLQRPRGARWNTDVPTAHGVAEADYQRDGQTLSRRLDGYRRLDAMPGAPAGLPWQSESSATIELGEDDVPVAITTDDALLLAAGVSEFPGFSSESRFELKRISKGRDGELVVPQLDRLQRVNLYAPPGQDEIERANAQAMAGSLGVEDVERIVDSAGRGLRPPDGFIIEATALLMGWPMLAEELRPMLEEAPDNRTKAFVADLLVSASTPEAQEVLRGAVEDMAGDGDPYLPVFVQHLSLLHRPEPQTLQLILDLHADASEPAEYDDEMRRGSLYVLGALARQISVENGALAQIAMERIRSDLATARNKESIVAALAGLGNAGFAEDAPSILANTGHPDDDIRFEAMSSSRFLRDGRVDDILFAALDDQDRDVAGQALSVLDAYRLDPQTQLRLNTLVIGGTYNRHLDEALIGVMGKEDTDHPLLAGALWAIHERTTDSGTKIRIERRLG